jgi:hypothetical protein
MAAYTSFAQDLENGEADVRVLYWLMFHKPSPDSAGGCNFDDLFWKGRDTDYDIISYDNAIAEAKESLDMEGGMDREDAEMLNAAGTIANHFQDESDSDTDVNAGVDLYDEMDE